MHVIHPPPFLPGFTHSPQLHIWASYVPVGVCVCVGVRPRIVPWDQYQRSFVNKHLPTIWWSASVHIIHVDVGSATEMCNGNIRIRLFSGPTNWKDTVCLRCSCLEAKTRPFSCCVNWNLVQKTFSCVTWERAVCKMIWLTGVLYLPALWHYFHALSSCFGFLPLPSSPQGARCVAFLSQRKRICDCIWINMRALPTLPGKTVSLAGMFATMPFCCRLHNHHLHSCLKGLVWDLSSSRNLTYTVTNGSHKMVSLTSSLCANRTIHVTDPPLIKKLAHNSIADWKARLCLIIGSSTLYRNVKNGCLVCCIVVL